MPEAWELHEGRFLQEYLLASAADALLLTQGSVVPAGKIRTILSGAYYPSVTETQICQWLIMSRAGYAFPVTWPQNIALGVTVYLPLVSEGQELILFPGECLRIRRAAATAGSTMNMVLRFIESDLPPYDYVEPQERKRITALKHSIARAAGGGPGPSGGRGISITPPGRGGGRGGSEPY